jgi:hypothetical protein
VARLVHLRWLFISIDADFDHSGEVDWLFFALSGLLSRLPNLTNLCLCIPHDARQDDNHLRAQAVFQHAIKLKTRLRHLDLQQVDPVVLTGLTRLTGLWFQHEDVLAIRTLFTDVLPHLPRLKRLDLGHSPLCRDIEPVVSEISAPLLQALPRLTLLTQIFWDLDHPGSELMIRAMAPCVPTYSQLAKVCLGVHLSDAVIAEMNAIAGRDVFRNF